MAALSWSQWNVGLLRVVWDTLSQCFAARHVPARLTLPHLPDLTVMITGATSGIGLPTAKALALAGAYVVLAVRNTNAAKDLICQWQPRDTPPLHCELDCLSFIPTSTLAQVCRSWSKVHSGVVMFSNLLQCRLPKEAGIDVICVHPGEVKTLGTCRKSYRKHTCDYSSFLAVKEINLRSCPPIPPALAAYCSVPLTSRSRIILAKGLRGFGYPLAPYYGPDLKIWSVGKHAHT